MLVVIPAFEQDCITSLQPCSLTSQFGVHSAWNRRRADRCSDFYAMITLTPVSNSCQSATCPKSPKRLNFRHQQNSTPLATHAAFLSESTAMIQKPYRIPQSRGTWMLRWFCESSANIVIASGHRSSNIIMLGAKDSAGSDPPLQSTQTVLARTGSCTFQKPAHAHTQKAPARADLYILYL